MTLSTNPLGWLDYIILVVILLCSAAMGLYHGLAKGGQKSLKRFFLADKMVFCMPVAMTLLASFISPITLLGTPAEIYSQGGQYLIFIFMQFLLFPSIAVIFVPLFHGLDITTAYQYLHRRYGLSLRIFCASIFILQTSFYLAIVMFTPALAIEAVTQFDIKVIILITGIVCTFYTTLGGMKAVIWTDVLMFFVIFITSILVIVMGTIEAGGIKHVWEVNKANGQLDVFNFPFDPTVRMTFLNVLFGTWMNSLSLWAVGQTAVQRFLSAKSERHAKMSVWANLPMVTTLVIITCFQGLVLFAFYKGDASPLVSGTNETDVLPYNVLSTDAPLRTPPNLTKADQILVYFVSEQFGHIPGYQGLFISCLFAGTLSTVSSGLNAIVAVCVIDIIRPFRHWLARRSNEPVTDDEKKDTSKSMILTAAFGIFALGLAFLATKIGSLVSLANSVFGALGGPLVAAFLLGMFWPRANSKGVLAGTVVSFILGIWMSAGAFLTSGQTDQFWLYKVSFNWYATFTVALSVIVAVPASEFSRLLFPDEIKKKIDPLLLSPWIRTLYKNERSAVPTKDDNDITLKSFERT